MASRLIVGILLSRPMVVGCGAVWSQDYPTKPIRIVTAQIGGGSDFTARLVAQGLTENMGQQVIVDNRPAGVMPGQIASRALPDGYTLLVIGSKTRYGR